MRLIMNILKNFWLLNNVKTLVIKHDKCFTLIWWVRHIKHGLYFEIDRSFKGKKTFKENLATDLILALLTYTAVNLRCVLFRAETFSRAWKLIKSMLFLGGDKAVLLSQQVLVVAVVISLTFIGHFLMRNRSLYDLLQKLPNWIVIVSWSIMLFGLMIVQSSGQQFIYFQF